MHNRLLAVIYFCISIFFMHLADAFVKYYATQASVSQELLLRFLAETALLFPYWLIHSKNPISSLMLNPFNKHIILRALTIVAASYFWFLSVPSTPIALVTTFAFLIPIVTLIFSIFFLHEKPSLITWLANGLALTGILISIKFSGYNNISSYEIFGLILGVVFFGLYAIASKKATGEVAMPDLMFITAVVATLLCLPFALHEWQPLTIEGYAVFLSLGVIATLTSYFLLKAYQFETVSFLTPFMYIELIFASFSSYFVFNETLQNSTIIGSLIILLANILCGLPINLKRKKTTCQ